MAPEPLTLYAKPRLERPVMIIGFSGWMDGGDVSTGTLQHLREHYQAQPLARIDPEDFLIYNFPGPMELSAMLRPPVRISDGIVQEYGEIAMAFHYALEPNLILFEGREPNVAWRRFGELFFEVVETFGVERVYFVGSVAGAVPHTRDARFHSSVSSESLKEPLEALGIRFSNYEGPASIVTYLLSQAPSRGVEMVSLVAEIPAYIQGPNPACIDIAVRTLTTLAGLSVQSEELRLMREIFEKRVSDVVEERGELKELITKLESDYDSEVFDTQMGDLKLWLKQQGIRVD